jgi:hypothetical protein
MKPIALALLLFAAATPPVPELRYFHYGRGLATTPVAAQTCVPLDAEVFAKASASLADVRLYLGDKEVPFAIVTAEAPVTASHPVLPLNAGVRAGRTEFDAAMPAGTYSDVELQIAGHDFQAKVEVSGSQASGSNDARHIGSYTIFDLSRQSTGRSTVLHLPSSDFRYLHFAIDGPIAPGAVTGIVVLPVADAPEPAYTPVAQSTITIQQGRATTLTFQVPAHVPVDRVLFRPGAEPVHFSRGVTVKIDAASPSRDDAESAAPTRYTGTLLRLQDTHDGVKFHEENFSVNTYGRMYDTPQTWTIAVDNGDDQPLQLGAVSLQMLQRQLCYQSTGSGGYVLRYGDAALSAPQYDYAAQFSRSTDTASARLEPEQANGKWQPRPDERAFTEQHPMLLWITLIAVVLLLAAVALRSRPRQG